MEEKIIKINNQRFFVTNDFSIEIEKTNLPNSIGFSSHLNILWKIEILEYNKISKELKVKVLNYKSNDEQKFLLQKKKNEINKIIFEKLDWKQLEPLLYTYREIDLQDLIYNNNKIIAVENKINKVNENEFIKSSNSITRNNERAIKHTVNKIEDKKEIIKHTYNLRITDFKIQYACATFKKFLSEIYEEIEFEIKNDYLEPNFDFIKFHFPKLFKSKIITVKIFIELLNNKIITKKAKCINQEIESIDKEFIDVVKYQRTIELIKNPKIDKPDKTLYTSEDIFTEFEDEKLGNIFNQNEREILGIILDKTNVRNRKQLEYLSGKLQSDKEIIRFTLKSKKNNFGFLFYIDIGATKHHFVWELLNSHATYIWSFEKKGQNLSNLFHHINNTINIIKTIGRDEYKQEYKNRLIDQDIDFDLIRHDKANSDFIDHFPNWRKRLDEKII